MATNQECTTTSAELSKKYCPGAIDFFLETFGRIRRGTSHTQELRNVYNYMELCCVHWLLLLLFFNSYSVFFIFVFNSHRRNSLCQIHVFLYIYIIMCMTWVCVCVCVCATRLWSPENCKLFRNSARHFHTGERPTREWNADAEKYAREIFQPEPERERVRESITSSMSGDAQHYSPLAAEYPLFSRRESRRPAL